MKRALAIALLALAGCDPPRGAGVYPESPEARQARQDAEYSAGEKLGLDGLRRALAGLGVRPSELAQVTEPDHQIEVLELRITPSRLRQVDPAALAGLVLDSNFRLTFADREVERAVDVSEELYRREMAREIAVLQRRGDWQRVPRRRAGEAIGSLARRIEHWCDFDPGGALQVTGGAWLEYSHAPVDAAVREGRPGRETEKFDCLRRVVYATQLRRYFIGYRGGPAPKLYPAPSAP